MRREPLFKTEAALCEAFIAWAKRYGWTAYAETAGWDIVLARPTGVQIGIQAKLKFNMKVLTQTLPVYGCDDVTGPDYRAILIGEKCPGAGLVCDGLGFALFQPERWYRDPRSTKPVDFEPGSTEVVGTSTFSRYGRHWFDWNPQKRIKLPDYVPDVAAGASGPVQLTPWKIGALRLTALLELRGHITRADFREHGINPTRWTVYGDASWVKPGAERGQWVRGTLTFDQQHPKVYAEIRAEIEKKLAKAGEKRPA